MEAVTEKPNFLSRPQGIALAILAIVAVWNLSPVSPVTIVLVAVAGLFLFGLRRPVWAMAALLISQFTITSYMVSIPLGFEISLRLLLLILTGLVLWRSIAQRQIDLGPKARRVLIPGLVLLGLSVVANLVNSDFGFVFKDFRNMVVGLLIIVLLPAVIRNLKELKILCGVAFVAITASAVIGLMQHYGFFGISGATIIPGFLDGVTDGQFSAPGISETQLELAYLLSAMLVVVLGVFLAQGANSGTRWLLLLSMVLMVPALYFTYTRSALLALVLGLVALVLFVKTPIRGGIVLSALLVVFIFIEVFGLPVGIFLGGRPQGAQEESAISRPILWQAGVAIALDNPILGIGGDQFQSISPQYAANVDPSLLAFEEERYWEFRTLGTQPPHNDFLNVWVSYGTLALVAYLWLFVAILHNFLDSYYVSRRRFIRGLSVGLAAALVAYGVNAFFHNVLMTLPLFWILAGFSLATAKLAVSNKKSPATSQG